jgi:DNA-binding transcriptional MerR regulator
MQNLFRPSVQNDVDSFTVICYNTVMMKEQSATFSIEELAGEVNRLLGAGGFLGTQPDHRVSAVPDARTIRYYTSLGLIDRPAIAGRQAWYGKRHVLQLLTIKAMQALALPLAEIQARIYGRSDEELEAILSALEKTVEGDRELPRVIRWREVLIQPGLKVVADENWTPPEDTTAIEEQIKAALAALQSDHNERRRKQ